MLTCRVFADLAALIMEGGEFSTLKVICMCLNPAGSRDALQLGSMVASLKRKSKSAAPTGRQLPSEVAVPQKSDKKIKKRKKELA